MKCEIRCRNQHLQEQPIAAEMVWDGVGFFWGGFFFSFFLGNLLAACQAESRTNLVQARKNTVILQQPCFSIRD